MGEVWPPNLLKQLGLQSAAAGRTHLLGKVCQDGLIGCGHKDHKEHDGNACPGENGLFLGQHIANHVLAQRLGLLQGENISLSILQGLWHCRNISFEYLASSS